MALLLVFPIDVGSSCRRVFTYQQLPLGMKLKVAGVGVAVERGVRTPRVTSRLDLYLGCGS